MTAMSQAVANPHRPFRNFAATVLGIALGSMAFCCLGAPLIMRTALYTNSTHQFYDVLVEQRFGVAGAHYAAIIVGDSSALEGVDTEIVKRKTGLETANLALFGFSGLDSYDRLIATYLAHNSVPSHLVIYVSAKEPFFDGIAGTYERTLVTFRYGSLGEIASLIWRNPGVVLWPAKLLGLSLWHGTIDLRGAYRDEVLNQLRIDHGRFVNPAPPLGDDCRLNTEADISTKDRLSRLRQKYAGIIADVAIYVAPMPECDSAYDYYLRQYRGIADNTIQRLPNRDFVDYTHPTPDGAKETSRLLAEFLAARR